MYPAPLTRRQQQIAALIAFGFSSDRIAATLRLSPHTIDLHTAAIHRRWSTGNRAVILRMVWREESRLDAALAGKPPVLPAPAGEWIQLYWFLLKALACYGLVQRVRHTLPPQPIKRSFQR